MVDGLPTVDELLKKLASVEGSDLHLKVGSPPAYRVNGELHLSNLPTLKPSDTEKIANELMSDRMRAEFDSTNEADFAYGRPDIGRFRVNCYRQRGSVNIVMRAVSSSSLTFDELGLPSVIRDLCQHKRGLVLVTGPTGSGKTTTLAAMIDFINSSRRCNIITLEDPIEVLHADKMSLVAQREVGVDTESFAEGLRRVLRQDPDVILIGEMRDQETVKAAIRAAETGHLVLSTLHTIDATETVNRIVDFFPSTMQNQIRLILAGSLRGIVSQRLLPTIDNSGRIPAVEVLINNERVFDRIVDPALTHSLVEVIADGEYYGMQTFDQSILAAFRKGLVSFNDALVSSTNPSDFKLAAENAGLVTHS